MQRSVWSCVDLCGGSEKDQQRRNGDRADRPESSWCRSPSNAPSDTGVGGANGLGWAELLGSSNPFPSCSSSMISGDICSRVTPGPARWKHSREMLISPSISANRDAGGPAGRLWPSRGPSQDASRTSEISSMAPTRHVWRQSAAIPSADRRRRVAMIQSAIDRTGRFITNARQGPDIEGVRASLTSLCWQLRLTSIVHHAWPYTRHTEHKKIPGRPRMSLQTGRR
jgi:hypothetical protein